MAPPTHLLRESRREGKRVLKRTLANLSGLSDAQIEAILAVLAGVNVQPAQQWFEIEKSLPHGHVQAVRLAMQRLGFESLLATRASPERDRVCAMVVARILAPHTKLATTRWWQLQLVRFPAGGKLRLQQSPERWPGVITSVASAAGAVGGIMFGFSESEGLVLELNGSLDTASSTIFIARHLNNAWVQGMGKRPGNQLVLSDDIVKLRELKRSEFYDEVLRPQHIAHGALSTLTFGSDLKIQFSVQKSLSDGAFKVAEVATLRRLLPHICRAMGVSLRLTRGLRPESSFDSFTHRLSCPALILSRSGNLIDANPEAQSLGARGGPWMLSRNGLRFTCQPEQRRLMVALKRVIEGAPYQSLVLSHLTQSFEVIVAAPKPRDVPWLRSMGHPGAILVLISARSRCAEGGGVTNTLSPAERRVAELAAAGATSSEIARSLSLSLNTIKTHTRRIYHKLNVRRQGELILLLNREKLVGEHSRCP